MLTRIELRCLARLLSPLGAQHIDGLQEANDVLRDRLASTGRAWALWECPCGAWWVVPTPPPNLQRCPHGARPPWEGDDR